MRSKAPSSWAVLALGGNLGAPLATLRSAASRLARELESARASGVYRSPPEGDADQPPYLNAAVAGLTRLSPRQLLALAMALEAEHGRERPYPGAPRTLDVDVIFAGDAVVDEPGLRVPHPRWSVRDFVVTPLLDVVPEYRDPETGRTVREVAEAAGWLPATLPRVAGGGELLFWEKSRG